jgi:hypothetical protein
VVLAHAMSHLASTMHRMEHVQFWQWTLRDPATGRVARTPRKMPAEEARALDAMAQRVDGTLEWRPAGGTPAPDPAADQPGMRERRRSAAGVSSPRAPSPPRASASEAGSGTCEQPGSLAVQPNCAARPMKICS